MACFMFLDEEPKGEGPGSSPGGLPYAAYGEVEIDIPGPTSVELDELCAACGDRDDCKEGYPFHCWQSYHDCSNETHERDYPIIQATAELGQLLPQLMSQISELALRDPPKAVEMVKGYLDLTRMTAELTKGLD